jgi:uncharacterized protein YkwD
VAGAHRQTREPAGFVPRWYTGPPATRTIAGADRTGTGDYGAVMSDRLAPAVPERPGRVGRRPPRRLAALVGLAFAASSIGLLATPAATLAWSANAFSSASEQQLLALTNQARASAGRKRLAWDSALASIARWRSKDMIVRDYFSHDIPGGGRVFDTMDARGYCYRVAGENIGWDTYPDDAATAQIQKMFMGSSGHRANILATDWDHIGIGAYKGADGKKMWTVLFADKCGSSPSATKPTAKPKSQPKPAATVRPTASPKPKPKATASPTPAAEPTPTATPDDILAPRGDAVAGGVPTADAGTADAGHPTATGASLRVVDRPVAGGLLDSILGGVAGFFLGG